MDIPFWLLLALSLTMFCVSWHAHRIGNERRDVALLGVFAVLLSADTVAATLV